MSNWKTKGSSQKFTKSQNMKRLPVTKRWLQDKHYHGAKKRCGNVLGRSGNFCDDVQLLKLPKDLGGHPFAWLVVHGFYHEVPSLVLYTDQQILDIHHFCCNGSHAETTVWGVDKTFNLSKVHVIITVYKNLSVCSHGCKKIEHPIFLGPTFLHGQPKRVSTHFFFWDAPRTALNDSKPSPAPPYPVTGTIMRRLL